MSSRRVTFVELEIKKCQLDYSVAPCTASIPATGTDKCFNCRATCQDLPNIDEADELVRYSVPSTNNNLDLDVVPNITTSNIKKVTYDPAVLDLGESIGQRSTLRVTFADLPSPDTDASGDRYRAERSYDPYTQGTYWGKFRARQPFLRGQSIYLIRGRDDQALAAMERRHFIVESTTGPGADGTYSITAKDALKLVQGDRAQAPVLSNGFLDADVLPGATTATLSPIGIGVEYPASGLLAVSGTEIWAFTRSGDVLTITRAQNNTEDVEHTEGGRVQVCLVYSSQKPSDILNDLLTNYAGVPSGFIPLADWETESDTYLNRVYSTVIAQPTDVKAVVNEVLQQTASTMWWDNLGSLMRWQVLRAPSDDAFSYDDSNYLQGSFRIAEQFQKRASQVWVYFGQLNPLLELSDRRNYTSSLANVSEASESNFDQVPAYREIFSRWIEGDSRETASVLANLILQRYATPPRSLTFELLRDSGVLTPELAGSYEFGNQFIQGPNGARQSMAIQVVAVIPKSATFSVQAEEVTFEQILPLDPNEITLEPSDGTLNYNIIDRYRILTGTEPSALTNVTVVVQSGFRIGSVSTAVAAMITGTGWPVGATVVIRNRGFIVGRGGNGGVGGSSQATTTNPGGTAITIPPSVGLVGGPALDADIDVTVDNSGGGVLSGGGGGGGGGGSAAAMFFRRTGQTSGPFFDGSFRTQFWAATAGSGGTGGAGYPGGNGGAAGLAVRRVHTDPREYSGPITPGVGGASGALEVGGGNSPQSFQDSSLSGDSSGGDPVVVITLTKSGFTANRGAGGALGAGGAQGNEGESPDRFYSIDGIESPTWGDTGGVPVFIDGAAGGAAGADTIGAGIVTII